MANNKLSDKEIKYILDNILYSTGEGGFGSLHTLLSAVKRQNFPISKQQVKEYYSKQFYPSIFRKPPSKKNSGSKKSKWIVMDLGYLEADCFFESAPLKG